MRKSIGNYEILNELGSGEYGQVYKGVDKNTKKLVAIKKIDKKNIQSKEELKQLHDFINSEISILSKPQITQNPNIVQFNEYFLTENSFYLVYEYCENGNLDDLLLQNTRLDDHTSLNFFRQLLNGYNVLYQNNIMHRDIKPANILIHRGILKLADFGFSKKYQNPEDLNTTVVGSPIYMSPELLLQKSYNMQSEIWAMGILLYECIEGIPPFQEYNITDLQESIRNFKKLKFKYEHRKELVELLEQMIVYDPQKRITWKQLLQNPLFANLSSQNVGQLSIINDNQSNNNRLMKLVLNERNKIFYVYLVIQNIIKSRYIDNLVLFVFMFTKFNLYLIQQQIENIIFELRPEKFQQLQNESMEQLKRLQKSNEFYEYSKILQQEEHQIKKNLQSLKKQLEYFFRTGNNNERFQDIYTEFQQLEVFNLEVYLKYMNLYLLHIHNQYQEYKTIDLLRHINEILDLIGIDQFFENILDMNQPQLEKQVYFQKLSSMNKESLKTMVMSKFDEYSSLIKKY